MSEAELILPHMRGGCVRVGNKVHTLFRLTSFQRTRQPATLPGRARQPCSGEPHAPKDAGPAADDEVAPSR